MAVGVAAVSSTPQPIKPADDCQTPDKLNSSSLPQLCCPVERARPSTLEELAAQRAVLVQKHEAALCAVQTLMRQQHADEKKVIDDRRPDPRDGGMIRGKGGVTIGGRPLSAIDAACQAFRGCARREGITY